MKPKVDFDEEVKQLEDDIETRKKRKESLENKKIKPNKDGVIRGTNLTVIIVCITALFFIYQKHQESLNSIPVMNISAFQTIGQCKIAVKANEELNGVDCEKSKLQAEKTNNNSGGALIFLNGNDGNKCYQIENNTGFAVIKKEDGDKYFSVPLYYVRNIDFNSKGLVYSNGDLSASKDVNKIPLKNVSQINKINNLCIF